MYYIVQRWWSVKLRIVVSNIVNELAIVVEVVGYDGDCRGRSKAGGIDVGACCLQIDQICSENF